MAFRVFTQTEAGRLLPVQWVQHATRFYAAELEILESDAEPLNALRMRVRITARSGSAATASIARRKTEASDQAAAERAERAGRAAGMSLLAARCEWLWELECEPSDSESCFLLCAVLAAVALGPVLPNDESTLFGVRGAVERADRCRKAPPS